ncbi:MAG: RIO1 family regulatory kinase/ATPase [Phototrophicaceae bacterium]
MPNNLHWDDEYLSELEQDLIEDRQSRRKRKKKQNHQPKKTEAQIINELADDTGIAGGFEMTYSPGDNDHHQNQWLQESLISFFYQDLLSDVLSMVKGGKEASVYLCRAHETSNKRYLAAKVYRPRMFRNLRNDGMYREGRIAIDADGKELNAKDWRAVKAITTGNQRGQAMSHMSWLMYENKTLRDLYDAGASVPEPLAVSENAILMDYVGDEYGPAPTLSEVRILPEEVEPLFAEVMRNIDIMLQQGIIHGDLSAYNILYWDGGIVLIDFPQVVQIKNNRHARKILTRDIVRVCEYFQSLGLKVDAQEIADKLWRVYGVEDGNPEEMLVNILEAVSFDDYEAKEYDD